MATAVRRRHEPQRVVSDLLAAGINEIEPACRHRSGTAGEGRARHRCRITVARLPFAREVGAFTFDGTPINEKRVARSGAGEFLNQQRNAVAEPPRVYRRVSGSMIRLLFGQRSSLRRMPPVLRVA